MVNRFLQLSIKTNVNNFSLKRDGRYMCTIFDTNPPVYSRQGNLLDHRGSEISQQEVQCKEPIEKLEPGDL